jgi:hypothetical protein
LNSEKIGKKARENEIFITSCTRKTTNWYFKCCNSNVAVWKSTGKKYGKMKCFIMSCTRKASNVAIQTLRFEKVREKSTGKWNAL